MPIYPEGDEFTGRQQFVTKNEEGIDLIEVIIAIILIMVAVVGLSTLMVRSQVIQAENETQDRASFIVQDIMEQSRQVPYNSLGNSKSTVCKTTSKTAANTSKLPCSGEYYFHVADGVREIAEKQTRNVSGTTYTIGLHVTKPVAKPNDGWSDTANVMGSPNCKTYPVPGTIPDPSTGEDEKDITDQLGNNRLCSVKRVTVEVSWMDASGKERMTQSSWIRAPRSHEEPPARMPVPEN